MAKLFGEDSRLQIEEDLTSVLRKQWPRKHCPSDAMSHPRQDDDRRLGDNKEPEGADHIGKGKKRPNLEQASSPPLENYRRRHDESQHDEQDDQDDQDEEV